MHGPLPAPPARRLGPLRLGVALATAASLGLATLGGAPGAWAAAGSGQDGAPDAWTHVPLRWSVARALLTEARCEHELRTRRACVHAIEAALRTRDGRLRLRPTALPPSPGEEAVRVFGGATVVRGREHAQPRDEGEARALIDAWDAVPPRSIPFERAASWAAKTAGFGAPAGEGAPAPHEASTTARAVEAFLRTSRDPFARLVPRGEDDRALRSAGAERVGIGVSLIALPGVLLVERVAAAGPAARAGVQPGDVVLSIDGWDLAGLGAAGAAHLLEGPEGALVRVGLRRDGRRLEVAPRRARLLVRHAFARVLRGTRGERVGYLRIGSLHSDQVCKQATDAVHALKTTSPSGLVLDLRGNPGGLVEQARCVADLFLGPGLVVGTLERTNERTEPYATRSPPHTGLPLVVLVDARTMSAAELLAAALRAHGRAVSVGQRTYGKTSVQDAFPWAEGLPVLVYRTVGVYTAGPERQQLQLVGLAPDLPVDAVGRERTTAFARRATWRYWEALRRPPLPPPAGPHRETIPGEATPAGRCAGVLGRETWTSEDGEAVGPQLATAASATRCAPALPSSP